MKKILLILTGGTIGSCCEHNTINVSSRTGYQLIDLFKQRYPGHGDITFRMIQPYQILSENLHPGYWEALINAIEAEKLNDFDGIIVTHGTDTLAYSAAALGLYFSQLNIPLLLVSSNYPLSHPDANGVDNFICAVEYICQQNPAGVFVPYKNPGQRQALHIATRLISSLPLSGMFISAQSQAYMLFQDGHFIELHPVNRANCVRKPIRPRFSARVLMIRPYPGLDYTKINMAGIDAVLHDLYHSGTAGTAANFGGQYSLNDFIDECRKRQTGIYLAPASKHPQIYESTRQLLDRGAEMLWDMCLEAAYVKLLLAYGNFTDPRSIREFLHQDVALEHVGPGS